MSHWSGWRPFLLLLYYQYWVLTKIPLVYPVVDLCHGEPAVLDLQNEAFCVLQQLIQGVGKLKVLDLGLSGS